MPVAFLIDTSALIHVLRDKTGLVGARYDGIISTQLVRLSQVTAFELLKGARDEREWGRLAQLLEGQNIVDATAEHWTAAARVVFDLRREGTTLKNPIDALIAQAALAHDLTVLHDDQDFEFIASVRPLKLYRFSLQESERGPSAS